MIPAQRCKGKELQGNNFKESQEQKYDLRTSMYSFPLPSEELDQIFVKEITRKHRVGIRENEALGELVF